MTFNDNHDPFIPWQCLREHIRGRTGKPISAMTLHRWKAKGVIQVFNLGGRNYVRLRETLERIGAATADAA